MLRLIFPVAITVASLGTVVFSRSAYELPGGAENILTEPLETTFSCEGRGYGYYADQDNNCEVFHVCLPVNDEEGNTLDMAHFSFVCGNQTIFNQETLTCAHLEDAVPCEEAASIYELRNSEFGVIFEDAV